MTSQIQQIVESRQKLVSAYRAVYAIGVLSLFLSLIAFVAGNQIPDYFILGIGFLIVAFLYISLGFFVQRKSKIALGIAMGFMLLNFLIGIYNLIQTGRPFSLIIPIAFFSQTIEGFKAIQILKSHT